MMGALFVINPNSSPTVTEGITTSRAPHDQDGAEVLILGCAGMARYRPVLEPLLQIPVIGPCQAAVAMALGRITLSQTHKTGA
jgi:Asp/Glu/hydantoin racemase